MAITPEQIREQLPMPSFVTVTKPLSDVSPPSRADTPPPPPPSNISQFVNYTAQSFGGNPDFVTMPPDTSNPQASATLQWVANTHAEDTTMPGVPIMSPSSKKGDLPVFTANGAIPFASNSNETTNTFRPEHTGVEVKKEGSMRDIWEVPDTPAR
jgi:histone deacetylase HOS3